MTGKIGRTGADHVVESLLAEGTDRLFMVPGGHNDPFMQPMSTTAGVATVVAAFEGGAAFMADGYSRATGHTGAAFGIGGPGLTNMTTALASSRADRIPVIAVSGEVPTSWEGRGGFQDASSGTFDDVVLTRTVCESSVRVESAAMLSAQLRNVLATAASRQGPVHLSIPLDVQRAPNEDSWTPLPTVLDRDNLLDESALDQAMAILAEGPATIAILAGPGVRRSEATPDLIAVAERWHIPVATTLGAKGVMPEDHDQALGVFGYAGNRWATDLILSDEVDVLIAVGTLLSQRDTLQWNRTMLPRRAFIHVDIDPANMGRTWAPDVALVASPGAFLSRLVAADGTVARALETGRARRLELLERIHRAGPFAYDEETRASAAVPLHPARVIDAARTAAPRDTVAVVDSGAHRAFAAQHWPAFGPRDYLSATNTGPMGAAIPLAVGAATARPHRPHIVFTGDGCMLMHGMELHTAVRHGLPVTVVVLDNEAYGNIWYRAHELGHPEESLTEIKGIDWVAFAEAMGATATRVDRPEGLRQAFDDALADGRPCLIDARTDKAAAKPTAPWAAAVREWEDDH